jgi:hypothetical protein
VVINSISSSNELMTANMGILGDMANIPSRSNDIKIIPSSNRKRVRTIPVRQEPPEDPCIKLIKEKTFLIYYQNGYKKGYQEGYVDARKKLSE